MDGNILGELADSSLLGVYIYQNDGKIVFANKAFCELTEYKKEEIIGKNLLDFIETDKIKSVQETIKRRMNNEKFQSEHINRTYKTRNGTLKPVKIFSQTIIYNNKPSGLVFILDNTEAKSFEKLFASLAYINKTAMQSNESKKLIQSICNILVNETGYALACIGRIDKNSKLYKPLFISTRIKKLDEIVKRVDISVDIKYPHGKGTVQMAYSTGQIAFIPDVLNNDNMKFWRDYFIKYNIHSACSIPIFKDKKLIYILLILDDTPNSFTSKQMSLLKELKSSISFSLEKIEKEKSSIILNKAIKKSHEWVLITDKKGYITYSNKAVSYISGYSQKELKGKKFTIFQPKRIKNSALQNIKGNNKYRERFEGVTKQGDLFYVDSITIPIETTDDKEYFINLSRDITEIVYKEKQLSFKSKMYDTLYNINKLYISSSNKNEFLSKLPDIFTRYTGMSVSFIMNFSSERTVKLSYASAKNGYYTHFINNLENILNNVLSSFFYRYLPFYKSMKNNEIYIVNDLNKKSFGLLNAFAKEHKIRSGCSIPIILGDNKPKSVLVMSSDIKNIFNKEIYKLLSIIQQNISFILDKLEKEKFNKMLLSAVNSGFDFVMILDEKFNIVWGNRSAENFFGYEMHNILNKSVLSLFDKNVLWREQNKLKENQTFSGFVTYKSKDGKSIDTNTIIAPFCLNDKTMYYIATGKDITKESKLKEKLDKLLYFDTITQLHNRQFFINALDIFLARTKAKSGVIGCMVMINPVNFFQVNRAFGFESGNQILKEIATRIKKSLRNYDIVAKLESDRFGVLLKELKNEEDALIIMTKVLDYLVKPYNIEQHAINISFDIGLSLIPKDGKDAITLINRAQSALADAKAKGENAFGFFRKDLETQAFNKLKLKNSLINAIKNREFIVYYQPYFNKRRKIIGAEALLRWKKDHKIISPMQFIPYLEETEMIVKVDAQVLDIVLRNILNLKKRSINIPPISINIAPQSLAKKDFDKKLLSKVSEMNIENSLINIEIIERSFLNNIKHTKTLIKNLRQQGFGLSIDDFGTGYSSLSYLAQLTADYIKIDMSFIRQITEDVNTRSIVEAIIYLTHKLNMQTIAEGIETQEQYDTLCTMGCDYFQGYLFSKPLPENEFEKMLFNN